MTDWPQRNSRITLHEICSAKESIRAKWLFPTGANLVIRGFKPKDAVEITLQEMIFEHRENPKLMEKARVIGFDPNSENQTRIVLDAAKLDYRH
jgi:hypothetical protein